MALYPIAQERGYMQEEGIDVKLILVRSELSIDSAEKVFLQKLGKKFSLTDAI